VSCAGAVVAAAAGAIVNLLLLLLSGGLLFHVVLTQPLGLLARLLQLQLLNLGAAV